MADLEKLGSVVRATTVPDHVPVLSRGKHRRARDGGCFMEFASFLAGERWSDHPDCTHALVASAARLVNDAMTDEGRGRLATLVPGVVGLDPDDPRLDALIARRCALIALPMSPLDEQRALAVALVTAQRMLARLGERGLDAVDPEIAAALDAAPDVFAWARDFAAGEVPRVRTYRRHAAPTAVRCAVQGILAGRPADPDTVLVGLLRAVIDEARALARRPATRVDEDRWDMACEVLTLESVGG